MSKQAVVDRTERPSERKEKENPERVIPQHCKDCCDLAACDLDFCLHWWH